MKRIWTVMKLFAGVFLLAVGLAACGPALPPEEAAAATEQAETATEEAAAITVEATAVPSPEDPTPEPEPTVAEEPAPTEDTDFDVYDGADAEDIVTTDSGLQYIEVEKGEGAAPEIGEVVSVHYTGWLEDGTQFDSSIDRGVPFQFALGRRMVIPGWEEGIALLNEGGKGRLIIPPDLAYGEQGSAPVIPPNAMLIFDVELVAISPGAPDDPVAVDEDDYLVTDSGLKYFDLEEGDGATPEDGQQIVMHYTGWFEDGTRFDSSLDRGQPVSFILGADQVIEGWDEGLSTMKVGGKRQLILPPDLAFGEEGAANGFIPPNATLLFEVELVDVR